MYYDLESQAESEQKHLSTWNVSGVILGCMLVSLGAIAVSSNYSRQELYLPVAQQQIAVPVASRLESGWVGRLPTNQKVSEVVLAAQSMNEVEGVEPQAANSSFKWMLGLVFSMSILPLVHFFKRWSAADDYDDAEDLEELEQEAEWAIAAAIGEVKLQYTAEVPIKNAAGAPVGTAEMCLKTAGVNSRHVIHKKLVAEFANRRQANAHTKTRAEVSGGGKKPYKQKGTGNARRGSNRSPLMRKGGVAFGPRNTKNYKQKINRKEGRLAISSLIQNRAPLITVINDMENSINVISTKKAAEMIELWKDKTKGDKVLLVIDTPDGKLPEKHPLVLSTNNMGMVRLMPQRALAVADLLWPHQIFVSDKALDALKQRFEVSEASEESEASAVA